VNDQLLLQEEVLSDDGLIATSSKQLCSGGEQEVQHAQLLERGDDPRECLGPLRDSLFGGLRLLGP
jgi:hypothetical protein